MAASAPGTLQTLVEVEAAVWRELAACVRDKQHAWRVAVLATVSDGIADARSIVLREFDAATRELMMFTDARSQKVAQLGRQPAATLVLWSPALGWQVRLRVQLSVQTSGLAVSSRWARLKMSPAAQDYLSPLPPGAPLSQPTPQRDSRDHFAVVTARIEGVDWLALQAGGHRRAAFDEHGARWLTP